MFRFLARFHSAAQEKLRGQATHKAFIPVPNQHLRGLAKVNGDLVAAAQKRQPVECATLDMDATLVAVNKARALHSYKGFKAYQPLNVWWAEHALMLHTDFRDGNVNAGYDILRVLIEAIELLPEGVQKVRVRSDTAAYDHSFLSYLALGQSTRFGVIEFAIGCDVTPEFKAAVAEVEPKAWKPIRELDHGKLEPTGQEYAEVCFVPSGMGSSKDGPRYRYLAIREPLEEQGLPGLEEQQKLPFQTLRLQDKRYKLFGVVTNIKDPDDPLTKGQGWDGERVIKWYRKRCGDSELAHSVLKSDLAGGSLPSGDFGENAAWWWMSVLAMNLNTLMKRLVLAGEWVDRRMKSLRYHLICLPGRIIDHARRLVVLIAGEHPALQLLIDARRAIADLAVVAAAG